jgi:hypothetical protein
MQLFFDEDLKEPVENNPIDFGEVWFLEQKTATVWLYNETDAFLRDIKVTLNPEQFIKVKAPSTLKAKQKAPITLTWQPTVLKGLKLEVDITAVEVHFG